MQIFTLLTIVLLIIGERKCYCSLKIIDNESLWTRFKGAFNKTYEDGVENSRRASLFKKTVEDVVLNNYMYDKNLTSYKMGLNKFSDVDREKIARQLKNINRRSQSTEGGIYYGLSEKISNLPREFDWRNFNFNTKVRDQGECGSCWAITVAGALEAQGYWYNRKNVELSPQELVDCSRKDFGCNGGWFETAFEYIANKPDQWLSKESHYAYASRQQECDTNARRSNTCEQDTNLYKLKCTGSKQLPYDNEEALKEAVIISGPVPVAIHVTQDLYMYSSGVFVDQSCVKTALNHAVLLIGYGEDNRSGLKYWTIKNSWGEDWGDGGYFKLLRGSNMCGVASYAVIPTIESYKL